MILKVSNDECTWGDITRTCGDDPKLSNGKGIKPTYYPHMRGWSSQKILQILKRRILPAHAGMILERSTDTIEKVHITRTCGDDPERCRYACAFKQYYPHMRGWSSSNIEQINKEKILPAHAGMILSRVRPVCVLIDITRTCGDDPVMSTSLPNPPSYYPHMRGWSFMFPDDALLGCILPAHAGMIPTTSVTFGESENITRTCGDDPRQNERTHCPLYGL